MGRLSTTPQLLNDMPLERANGIFQSPIHHDAYRDLAELILGLRQCRSYEDYYHFQQELLGKVLAVQEHGQACRRIIARLRPGKSLPADAPELRSGGDVTDLAEWELERGRLRAGRPPVPLGRRCAGLAGLQLRPACDRSPVAE